MVELVDTSDLSSDAPKGACPTSATSIIKKYE